MSKQQVSIRSLKFDHEGPIVIIGPNGAGKSTLGVEITNGNNSTDRISAKRNIIPQDNFSFSSEEQASQQFEQSKVQSRSNLYAYSSDFQQLLIKLFAEETGAAIDFKRKFAAAQNKAELIPEETTLSKVQLIWKSIFPKRELIVDRNKLHVKSEMNSKAEIKFQPNQLSDGELVSFYMIARVLDSKANILIIDEPEIHLHPALAKVLWNTLEDVKPEIRFIYITHDFGFAESRRDAKYLIVRPNSDPEILNTESESFPQEFLHLLLGAVSGDLKADRVVFCEGPVGGRDYRIYSSWFDSSKTKVIPVGSCDRVKICFEALASGKIIKNLKPIGIIDRDFRSEAEIKEIRESGIFVLDLHEIESIIGVREIFCSIAEHLGLTDVEMLYGKFKQKSIEALNPLKNKVLLERVKRVASRKSQSLINSAPCHVDLIEMSKLFSVQINNIPAGIDSDKTLLEEESILNASLASDWGQVLKVFPGKPLMGKAEELLGAKVSVIVGLLEKALSTTCESYKILKPKIEAGLVLILPPR